MEGVTEELPRKSEEKTKKNQPKRNKSNSKSLSSQEETIPNLLSGLFGDDELKPTSNEQEVHVQARPGTSEREGGHQRNRMSRWERANNMKMSELTQNEWLDVVEKILCLTPQEARDYLSYLMASST